MLKDGTYAAWFKTSLGQGTGIVHVAHGKIWGRDGVMTYDGTCEVDGDRFTATVMTRRHSEGLPTVFGDDREARRPPVVSHQDTKILQYVSPWDTLRP